MQRYPPAMCLKRIRVLVVCQLQYMGPGIAVSPNRRMLWRSQAGQASQRPQAAMQVALQQGTQLWNSFSQCTLLHSIRMATAQQPPLQQRPQHQHVLLMMEQHSTAAGQRRVAKRKQCQQCGMGEPCKCTAHKAWMHSRTAAILRRISWQTF